MTSQSDIIEIMGQLGAFSAHVLGKAPHKWAYNPAEEVFTLTFRPAANETIKELIEEMTVPALGKKAISADIPTITNEPGKLSKIIVNARKIDKEALQKVTQDTAFATPIDPVLSRPIAKEDIALLNNLGVAKHFPSQFTDGKWKIATTEEGDVVARLVLKFPSRSSTSSQLSDLITRLRPALELSARDPLDSSHEALHFNFRPGSMAYAGLRAVYVEVTAIDPEYFSEKVASITDTVRRYGEKFAVELQNIKAKESAPSGFPRK